jgi:hypothetical protein
MTNVFSVKSAGRLLTLEKMTKKFCGSSASIALLLFLNAGVLRAHNLQICKVSDLVNPVGGTFNFTISIKGGSTIATAVAVGGCSGVFANLGFDPITITEADIADVVLESIVVSANAVSSNVNLNKNSVIVVLPEDPNPVVVTFTNGSVPPGGRWTGGGSINPTTQRVTHGFELHCSVNALPNNLEVNWPDDAHHRFHLDALTSVTCGTMHSPCGNPGNVPFITATGTGAFDGVAGATIGFTFMDAGEPGVDDWASCYSIVAAGTNVLTASGCLQFGNHQFHPTH